VSRWDAIDAWRRRLRDVEPDVGLSPANTRLGLQTALDLLDPLPAHLDAPAPRHAVFVAASTVFTAPLEWLALLLGRGGRVTLKAPESLADWFETVATLARAEGLPLESTTDRSVLTRPDDTGQLPDVIVAMGSDATLAAVRSTLTDAQRLVGFGTRFSVALWTDPAHADAVALDLAMYDGRGCMSPVAILTPIPDAVDRLATAMQRAEDRWPCGALAPGEAARIRSQSAVARVLGAERTGPGWAVQQLPLDRFDPSRALPRVAVLHPADEAAFRAALRSWIPHLSTVGSDVPLAIPGVRVCPLGQMQRPPLVRLHDGVDWIDPGLLIGPARPESGS
jgi:hypothetical protein